VCKQFPELCFWSVKVHLVKRLHIHAGLHLWDCSLYKQLCNLIVQCICVLLATELLQQGKSFISTKTFQKVLETLS
jgi:hypothetical protein